VNNRTAYKWWIVVAGTIISACSAGIFGFAFTAFFNPILEEFQWPYALVSLAFSIRGFEVGIAAPFVGIACDRVGPKKILIIGVVVTGLGYILVSSVQNLWSFYLIFEVLGIGKSLCGLIATMTLVSRWFGEKASLAMGILTAGNALGGLMTSVITMLIIDYGWRSTGIIMGIAFLLLCVPIVLSIRDPSPAHGSLTEEAAHKTGQREDKDRHVIKEVLGNKAFYILSAVLFLSCLPIFALIVHQMPHLINIGISSQSAAFTVGIFAVANITGRLLFGIIGDRFDKRTYYAITVALESIGTIFFILSNTLNFIIPSLILLGIGFGALTPLRPGLQIQLFGIRNFGIIQGMVMVSVTAGVVSTPLFAGWMFDLFGDYKFVFIILAVLALISIPLVLALPKSVNLSSLPDNIENL